METTNTPQTFIGQRMFDVRAKIAAAGQGLERVDKLNDGHYIVSTLDGRCWNVIHAANGIWRGEE